MNKTICPQCGTEGFLQVRGNHQHIQHYQDFKEGKRTYTYHKVQVTASNNLQVTKPDLASDSKIVVGRARFELATFRLSVERSSRAELPAHTSP